ncbi:hypothetical protein ACTI_48900 [Actinoplanes sp. OR16]|nr:hypothetical protein ACTI_48900 [Actinoplanes sp. OR16]
MLRSTSARRLALFGGIFLVAAVGLGIFALSRIDDGLSTGDQVSSMVSGCAGLVSLATSIVFGVLTLRQDRTAPDEQALLDAAADTLAQRVRRQWEDEIGKRRLRHPRPLRLSWNRTALPVGPPAYLPEEGSLVIDGDAGEPAAGLVTAFRRLPARQLVVLGEPGAGKSTLSMLLTVAALPAPGSPPDQPVPVLLALASWDPDEDLRVWAARAAAETYPEVAAEARALIDHNRVLLVLDGLDELPAAVRRQAARHLGDAAAVDGLPMVVTCRRTEYDEVVTSEGRLPLAAEVTIAPVTVEDAIAFLTVGEPAGGGRWETVAETMRTDPDGPLATALSTPLMISLARTVYQPAVADPDTLTGFGTADEVRDHLLSRFVPTVYRNSEMSAEQAERYLRTLARHLRFRIHSPNLAWWELARAVPAAVIVVPMTVLVGLVGGIAGALVWPGEMSSRFDAVAGWSFGIVSGLVAGLHAVRAAHQDAAPARGRLRRAATHLGTLFRDVAAAMVVTGLPMLVLYLLQRSPTDPDSSDSWTGAWMMVLLFNAAVISAVQSLLSTGLGAVRGALPVRSQWRLSRLPGRMLSGLALGAAIGVVFGIVVGVIAGILGIDSLEDPTVGAVWGVVLAGWPLGLTVAVGLTLVIGLPVGVGLWLTTPVDDETTVSPRAVFRSDALTSLIIAVTGGLAALAAGATAVVAEVDVEAGGIDQLVTVVSVTCLLVGALLLGGGAPWASYAIARSWLALWRRLPWRTIRFLEEAHEREILRQVGAVYQFRHDLLERYLARTGRPRLTAPESRTFADPADLARDRLRRRHQARAHTAAGLIIVLATVQLVILPSVELGYDDSVGGLRSRHAALLTAHADDLAAADPAASLQLRIAAAEVDGDVSSLAELAAVLRVGQDGANARALLAEDVVQTDRWLLTHDADGTLYGWDSRAASPSPVPLGRGDFLLQKAGEGAILTEGGTSAYWDLSGDEPRPTPLPISPVDEVLAVRDGILVVNDQSDVAWAVDLQRPEAAPLELGSGLGTVRVLPGRRWIIAQLSGEDGGDISVVDRQTGQRADLLSSKDVVLSAELFGATLRLQTFDKEVEAGLWDLTSWPPEAVPSMTAGEDPVSADGRWALAVTDRDDALLIRVGGAAQPLHRRIINAAFDAGGALITLGSDGVLLRWDLTGPVPLPDPLATGIDEVQFTAPQPALTSADPGWSTGETSAVTAALAVSSGGHAILFDLRERVPGRVDVPGDVVDASVVESGEWAFVRDGAGTVGVWNLHGGARRVGVATGVPESLQLSDAARSGAWVWLNDGNSPYLWSLRPFRSRPVYDGSRTQTRALTQGRRAYHAGGNWATYAVYEDRFLAWGPGGVSYDLGSYVTDLFPAANGTWALLFHDRGYTPATRKLVTLVDLTVPLPAEPADPVAAACAAVDEIMSEGEWEDATDGMPYHRICRR